MVTGFGKNMKNVLLNLFNDDNIEVIEAANGAYIGSDLKTPWKSYGTAPTDPSLISQINADPAKGQAASYGFYTIDEIVEDCKPDVYLGIEDLWAFRQFEDKPWWNKIPKIIWTTIDSIPLLDETNHLHNNVEKMLVWASFAEEEMKKLGMNNVETLHGAVNYSNFKPLENRQEIRSKFKIKEDDFVIGFVFKNQLRKSVPNLIAAFAKFHKDHPNAKLLLHTDWSEINSGWHIDKLLKEHEIPKEKVLSTYLCRTCANYFIHPYIGEEKDCPACGAEKSVFTKTNTSGVSESQLNEVYNCMDVYCHPFTSGGQELPIQEAKAAGLITLVTEYSCGTDSCYKHQGGLPLEWEEYREPNTLFIKATTKVSSIIENLEYVFNLDKEEKEALVKAGSDHIQNKFCIKKITDRIKEIVLEVKKDFVPKAEEKETPKKQVEFGDLLDDEGKDKRIAVVIPKSEQDVFLVNGLMGNLKSLYPEHNIYFITEQKYFDLVEDNPHIHKLIPFQEGVDSQLLLEGRSEHEGYFDMAFLPHATTQKFISYLHNGKDKLQFTL
ncbi:hypothetical protein N9955_00875 [bacterium]|nr:hypothetical protein [bacterium]